MEVEAPSSNALVLLPPPSCLYSPVARGIHVVKDTEKYFHLLFLGDRFLSQTQDSNFHFLRQCFGKQNHLYQNNHRILKFVLLQFGGLAQKEKFSSRKEKKQQKNQKSRTSYWSDLLLQMFEEICTYISRT